ncbi:MAG: hypothetical protein ACJATO_001522, partial [Arenicella sp.]
MKLATAYTGIRVIKKQILKPSFLFRVNATLV